MKQTAMQWLISQLNTWQSITDEDTNQTLDIVRKMIEQAKQMEKQQIIDAVYHNCSSMTHYDLPCGEQYYNETFKSE